MTSLTVNLVTFTVEGRIFAVSNDAVERVCPIAAVSELPKAPSVILGVLNYQGQPIPVMSVRERFGYPRREFRREDHLLIARTPLRQVALWVDQVTGILNIPRTRVKDARSIDASLEFVKGVAILEEDLVYVSDLEQFLSAEEEFKLSAALHEGESRR